MNWFGNSIARIVERINSQFTESKAFMRSTFNIPLGLIFFLLYPLTSSVASSTFSPSNLPGRKADCAFEITEGSRDWSLAEGCLEFTLYSVLHKEIGLKSETEDAFGIFGMRIIVVAFHCFNNFLF